MELFDFLCNGFEDMFRFYSDLPFLFRWYIVYAMIFTCVVPTVEIKKESTAKPSTP